MEFEGKYDKCPRCRGNGWYLENFSDDHRTICRKCSGTGLLEKPTAPTPGVCAEAERYLRLNNDYMRKHYASCPKSSSVEIIMLHKSADFIARLVKEVGLLRAAITTPEICAGIISEIHENERYDLIKKCKHLRTQLTEKDKEIKELRKALFGHRWDLHCSSKRPCPTCQESAKALGLLNVPDQCARIDYDKKALSPEGGK